MKDQLSALGGWWSRLTDKQKKIYSIAGAGVAIVGIASVAGLSTEKKGPLIKADTPIETQLMVPNKPRLELDQMTAELVALRNKVQGLEQQQKTQADAAKSEFNNIREAKAAGGNNEELNRQIRELELKLSQVQANSAVAPPQQQTQPLQMVNPVGRGGNSPALNSPLPVPNKSIGANNNGGIPQMPADGAVDDPAQLKGKEVERPAFRIIDGSTSSEEKKDLAGASNSNAPGQNTSGSQKIVANGGSTSSSNEPSGASSEFFGKSSKAGNAGESWLPAGAIIKGVLLNGMDAPTSSVALKNPTPVLIRIKHEAILPNYFKFDIRECFAIGSGHGVMSTERVILRMEKLSCVRNNGSAIETKLEGYANGEDGKVGLRGRLVTKQGALVARSLVAGFLSGVSKGMAPTSVFNYAQNTTGITQTSVPDMSTVLQNAALNGVGESLNAVAKFWLDMAKEMFPVVELDAGRPVEIVMINGVSVKLR